MTEQTQPALAGQVDRHVRPGADARRQALGDVLRQVTAMQGWELEWEWMADKSGGQFIKRHELVEWLKQQLKA